MGSWVLGCVISLPCSLDGEWDGTMILGFLFLPLVLPRQKVYSGNRILVSWFLFSLTGHSSGSMETESWIYDFALLMWGEQPCSGIWILDLGSLQRPTSDLGSWILDLPLASLTPSP